MAYDAMQGLTAAEYYDTLLDQTQSIYGVPGNLKRGRHSLPTTTELWPTFDVAYTTSNLNLRSGPNTTASIIATIPSESRIKVIIPVVSRSLSPFEFMLGPSHLRPLNLEFSSFMRGKWLRVKVDGSIGWVHGDYLRMPMKNEVTGMNEEAIRQALEAFFPSRSIAGNVFHYLIGIPFGIFWGIFFWVFHGDRSVRVSSARWSNSFPHVMKWRGMASFISPTAFFFGETIHHISYGISAIGILVGCHLLLAFVLGYPAMKAADFLIRNQLIPSALVDATYGIRGD